VARGCELVGDEPIPELRIVGVDVDDRVDQVCIIPVARGHRGSSPLVETLRGEAQHPTGHLDGDAVVGEATDQRGDHLGAASLAK
jgi:hypothetical protein